MRVGIRLAIALTIAFGLVDVWLVGDAVIPALILHGVVVALLAGCLWAQSRPWWAVLQRFAAPAAVVLAALAFDAAAIASPMPPGFAALTTMAASVFLCTLIRTTVAIAAGGSVVMVAGYVASAVASRQDPHMLVYYLAFVATVLSAALSACYLLERLRRREFLAGLELAEARARSDALLRNVLPDEIADRLRAKPATIAMVAEEVTVMFADIVDFTPVSATLAPTELVALLDELFRGFDALCEVHGVEKIKTIGDAYMAAAGLPSPCAEHAQAAAEMALDMLKLTRDFRGWPGGLALRIGISSGPVVAGVIGERKFAYDLWGETVNTASRMQSHATPGAVHVSEETFRLLRGGYAFGPAHQMAVKGKGIMTTYQLVSRLDPTPIPELTVAR